MGLLSIFQRKKSTDNPVAGAGAGKGAGRGRATSRGAPVAAAYVAPQEAAEAVRDARTRARRRLMGATVLLLAGIIGFPLLFETRPRPIPVDLPINIPSRTAPTAPDSGVAGHASRPGATAAIPIAAAPSSGAESVSYDARPSAAAQAASTLPARGASETRVAATEHALAAAAATSRAYALLNPASAPAPQAAPPRAAPASAGPVRSTATVSGTAAPLAAAADTQAASDAARYVVQVGAFADDARVHEARGKVEHLGFKTYTQAVDTPAGRRVRVRAGPYATKQEADQAAGRIKAEGLPAVVLEL